LKERLRERLRERLKERLKDGAARCVDHHLSVRAAEKIVAGGVCRDQVEVGRARLKQVITQVKRTCTRTRTTLARDSTLGE
jgi:hypothetical protein